MTRTNKSNNPSSSYSYLIIKLVKDNKVFAEPRIGYHTQEQLGQIMNKLEGQFHSQIEKVGETIEITVGE
jgi:hypothetical protein